MKKFALALGLQAILSACSSSGQLSNADRMRADAIGQMQKEIAACQQQYPHRVRGKAAEALRCSTSVHQRYAWVSGRGLNNDLVKLAAAKSVEAGERYDAGKIGDAQLDLEIAAIEAELNTGTQVRLNQATMAASAEMQANAAQQQAAMQRAKAIQDAFAPPKQTSCTSFGNTLNCTSN